MIPPILVLAVLPFGSTLFGVPMVIADIDIGVPYVFAVSSLGVYGIVLAGWASNSKYPFLGGIRCPSSQMISYELALGLSVIPVFPSLRYTEPAGHRNLAARQWLADRSVVAQGSHRSANRSRRLARRARRLCRGLLLPAHPGLDTDAPVVSCLSHCHVCRDESPSVRPSGGGNKNSLADITPSIRRWDSPSSSWASMPR